MGNKYSNKGNYNYLENLKIAEKRKQLELNIEYDGDISITIRDGSGVHMFNNQEETKPLLDEDNNEFLDLSNLLKVTKGLVIDPIPISPLASEDNIFKNKVGVEK